MTNLWKDCHRGRNQCPFHENGGHHDDNCGSDIPPCAKNLCAKRKEYIPIDDWAEEEHSGFLNNVQVTVEMLTGLNPNERYSLVRAIMQFARQEFEK
jgi:hypothetical protein